MSKEFEYNNLPVYHLVIDETDLFDGVSIMSLVDDPAVKKDFLKLDSQLSKLELKLSVDDDKRIVTGVALRADYPIYRDVPPKGKFYFKVSGDEIEKIVCKFMREGRTNNVNLGHNHNVEGVYLIESFILNDNHKLTYPEFNDIENGSWMVSYKVDNDEVWKDIKANKLNGFSVEVLGELVKDTINREDKYLEYVNILNELIKYESNLKS